MGYVEIFPRGKFCLISLTGSKQLKKNSLGRKIWVTIALKLSKFGLVVAQADVNLVSRGDEQWLLDYKWKYESTAWYCEWSWNEFPQVHLWIIHLW